MLLITWNIALLQISNALCGIIPWQQNVLDGSVHYDSMEYDELPGVPSHMEHSHRVFICWGKAMLGSKRLSPSYIVLDLDSEKEMLIKSLITNRILQEIRHFGLHLFLKMIDVYNQHFGRKEINYSAYIYFNFMGWHPTIKYPMIADLVGDLKRALNLIDCSEKDELKPADNYYMIVRGLQIDSIEETSKEEQDHTNEQGLTNWLRKVCHAAFPYTKIDIHFMHTERLDGGTYVNVVLTVPKYRIREEINCVERSLSYKLGGFYASQKIHLEDSVVTTINLREPMRYPEWYTAIYSPSKKQLGQLIVPMVLKFSDASALQSFHYIRPPPKRRHNMTDFELGVFVDAVLSTATNFAVHISTVHLIYMKATKSRTIMLIQLQIEDTEVHQSYALEKSVEEAFKEHTTESYALTSIYRNWPDSTSVKIEMKLIENCLPVQWKDYLLDNRKGRATRMRSRAFAQMTAVSNRFVYLNLSHFEPVGSYAYVHLYGSVRTESAVHDYLIEEIKTELLKEYKCVKQREPNDVLVFAASTYT